MTGVHRDTLSAYIDTLLDCSQYVDYAPNGLQVAGRSDIQMLCTAVTANLTVIEEAIKKQADALLVHHGYFWKGESPQLVGMKGKRIAQLFKQDINLLAYHLPLDAHPVLGNNAQLAKKLEVTEVQSHPVRQIPHLLWTGKLSQACTGQALATRLNQQLHQKPLHIAAHQRNIHTIAWCTGAAQDFIEDAAQLGADAYISGEVSERTYYQAMELNIDYFAAGHHATERGGIQALGQHLAERFKVQHYFIDSFNPI